MAWTDKVAAPRANALGQEADSAQVRESIYRGMSSVKQSGARCQWLMPVIVATQEADIRRIAVIVPEALSPKPP
jgi:hypothetical protein